MGNKSVWLEGEIDFLKNNYSKYSYKELAGQLNKDVKAIEWQMRKYGLERVTREKWTAEEEKFILENRSLTYEEAAKQLNRPIGSIKKKVQKLGITLESKYFKWTDDKIKELRKLYIDEQLVSSQIAEKLNTTQDSVEMKIFKLGFRKDIYTEWSIADLEYLKNFYKTKTYEQIAVDLGRTKDAVRSKFRELDLGSKDDRRRWSEDEIDILKINASMMDSKELSEKLDRDRNLVLRKAREVNVKIKNDRFDWNEDNNKILVDNYLDLSNEELSLKLGTTRSSVQHQLNKFNLRRPVSFEWDDNKDGYLKDNFESSSYKNLAKELGITRTMVKRRLNKLNLKKNYWEDWQDEFLYNNVSRLSNKEIAEVVDKSELSVSSRIHEKSLQRKEKEPDWEEKDYEYLKCNFKYQAYDKIGKYLNRTQQAINHKASELSLAKYPIVLSQEQIDYIKQNYNNMTNAELSNNTGLSIDIVKKHLSLFELFRDDICWKEEEIEYVKKFYQELTNIELAKEMNRTEGSIQYILCKCQFKRKQPYIIPEKNVGHILITLLGKDKVKAQYNDGVEKPNVIYYPNPIRVEVDGNVKIFKRIRPDYELLHSGGEWIPSEYFGFKGEEYDLRKKIKKSYLKRKYGSKFISFNIQDLRNPDLVKLKLQKSGYIT